MPSQHEISDITMDSCSRSESDPSLCKENLNSSFDTSSTASTVLDTSSCTYSEPDIETLLQPIPLCRSRPSFGSSTPSSGSSSRSSSTSSTRSKPEPFPSQGSEIPLGCHFRGKGKQRRSSLCTVMILAAGTLLFLRSAIYNPGSHQGGEHYNTWVQFMNNEATFLKHKLAHTTRDSQFTILLKGDRIDFIHQSIDAHSGCAAVKEIQLDFGSKPVPERTLARDDKVTISKAVKTNAVLLLSQDVLLSCDELDKAFDAWKSDTGRLVGFFGYEQTSTSDSYLRAALADNAFSAVKAGSSSYSVVSDKAVFANNLYIDSIPTYDYRSSSCHLLLSLQVSAFSGKAPLVIKAKPRMLSSGVAEEDDSECLSSWLHVNLSQGASTLM